MPYNPKKKLNKQRPFLVDPVTKNTTRATKDKKLAMQNTESLKGKSFKPLPLCWMFHISEFLLH